MNSVLESIAPYILTGEDLPKSGLWYSKKCECRIQVIGTILGKDLFKVIPCYREDLKKYKDDCLLVIASCVTKFDPELSAEDYIPSLGVNTPEWFERYCKPVIEGDMNSVLESIAPYALTDEDLPKPGLWRCKKYGGIHTLLGVILAKDLFKAIPTYGLARGKYKDEQIIVIISCVTKFDPELSAEDYIPSIAIEPLERFKKYKEEDVSNQFASGPLAAALASMYI